MLDDTRRFFERERRAEQTPDEKRAALALAYQQVAEHPAGEIVLRDMFTACGLLSTPQVLGDAYATHVNIGRHQIGLHMLDRLRWSFAELQKLGEAVTADFLGRMDHEQAEAGDIGEGDAC